MMNASKIKYKNDDNENGNQKFCESMRKGNVSDRF